MNLYVVEAPVSPILLFALSLCFAELSCIRGESQPDFSACPVSFFESSFFIFSHIPFLIRYSVFAKSCMPRTFSYSLFHNLFSQGFSVPIYMNARTCFSRPRRCVCRFLPSWKPTHALTRCVCSGASAPTPLLATASVAFDFL